MRLKAVVHHGVITLIPLGSLTVLIPRLQYKRQSGNVLTTMIFS